MIDVCGYTLSVREKRKAHFRCSVFVVLFSMCVLLAYIMTYMTSTATHIPDNWVSGFLLSFVAFVSGLALTIPTIKRNRIKRSGDGLR